MDVVADLAADLDELRAAFQLPGAALTIVNANRILARGVSGVRRIDHPAAATLDDKWHVGSITKSLTAFMIARLVERGIMHWDMTIAQAAPLLADAARAYQRVTLAHLLSHCAGVAANPSWLDLMRASFFDGDPQAQRVAIARRRLAIRPAAAPGEQFLYSNLGYMIAGVMAESVTGACWEDLMAREAMAPIGLCKAGFGPPGRDGSEQPWGHRRSFPKRRFVAIAPRSRFADNPAALGPAGTMHMTIGDLARYARFMLAARDGRSAALKADTVAKLFTPAKGAALAGGLRYGCGWVVAEPDDAFGAPISFWHDGSNTAWYALIALIPEHGLGLAFVANGFDMRWARDNISLQDAVGRIYRRWRDDNGAQSMAMTAARRRRA